MRMYDNAAYDYFYFIEWLNKLNFKIKNKKTFSLLFFASLKYNFTNITLIFNKYLLILYKSINIWIKIIFSLILK